MSAGQVVSAAENLNAGPAFERARYCFGFCRDLTPVRPGQKWCAHCLPLVRRERARNEYRRNGRSRAVSRRQRERTRYRTDPDYRSLKIARQRAIDARRRLAKAQSLPTETSFPNTEES